MSYFHTILRDRYPDANPKVHIEQEGLALTLVIETEDGMRDQYERTLDQYGDVLRQRMRPEEILKGPLQVMELRNQLRFANAQLESQQELLHMTRQQLDEKNMQITQLMSYIGTAIQSDRTASLPPINVNVTNQLQSNPNVTAELTAGGRLSEQAQKILDALPTPEKLVELLGLVQEEVQVLDVSETEKQELKNEVEGAAIQAQKPTPDKVKVADRLKNAATILTETSNLAGKAAMIGQTVAKAIDWISKMPPL